jgi:hypothetical protein
MNLRRAYRSRHQTAEESISARKAARDPETSARALAMLARSHPREVLDNPALALVALEDPSLYLWIRQEAEYAAQERACERLQYYGLRSLALFPGAEVLWLLLWLLGLLPGPSFLVCLLATLLAMLPCVVFLLFWNARLERRLARLREQPRHTGPR